MAAVITSASNPPDHLRRALLNTSDQLLDRVEQLRLADQLETPPQLQKAIYALRDRLGPGNLESTPRTLDGAHSLVLAVQERLLALSQGRTSPHSHPGRAPGSPLVAEIGPSAGRWKLLVLPSRPEDPRLQDQWRKLALATLERGLDRWAYARHQVVSTLRRRLDSGLALKRARAAWSNYWDLHQDAERLGITTRVGGSDATGGDR
jgi:hypothetical protein